MLKSCWRLCSPGTATVNAPAAAEARQPFSLSSSTIISAGGTPSLLAAVR
jgi:hypothetical protein